MHWCARRLDRARRAARRRSLARRGHAARSGRDCRAGHEGGRAREQRRAAAGRSLDDVGRVRNLLRHESADALGADRGAAARRRAAPQATVIEMSSGGMYNAPLTLDYMGMKNPKKYNGVYAYAVHKRGQAELVKYWHARHGAQRPALLRDASRLGRHGRREDGDAELPSPAEDRAARCRTRC